MPETVTLDYVLNTQRRCLCACNVCEYRDHHSVKNCSHECDDLDHIVRFLQSFPLLLSFLISYCKT